MSGSIDLQIYMVHIIFDVIDENANGEKIEMNK